MGLDLGPAKRYSRNKKKSGQEDGSATIYAAPKSCPCSFGFWGSPPDGSSLRSVPQINVLPIGCEYNCLKILQAVAIFVASAVQETARPHTRERVHDNLTHL